MFRKERTRRSVHTHTSKKPDAANCVNILNQSHTNGTHTCYPLQMSKARQLWHVEHARALHDCAMTAHGCQETDTEIGTPSGIPQRHNAHSRSYWFTKVCYSACLSHFAAPFIIIPAKTFNAENSGDKQSKFTRRQEQMQWVHKAQRHPDTRAQDIAAAAATHSAVNGLHPWMYVWRQQAAQSRIRSQHQIIVFLSEMCKWSFRRFTYGNLVTTSPSSKW